MRAQAFARGLQNIRASVEKDLSDPNWVPAMPSIKFFAVQNLANFLPMPVRFELVINPKTVKTIGLDISPFMQQRADALIE